MSSTAHGSSPNKPHSKRLYPLLDEASPSTHPDAGRHSMHTDEKQRKQSPGKLYESIKLQNKIICLVQVHP